MRLIAFAILFLLVVAFLAGAALGLVEYAVGRVGLRIRALVGARRTRRAYQERAR